MLSFLAIDTFLKKLGSAFNGIFKILIPALLFYFPFKVLTFTAVILLSLLGISTSLGENIETVYIVLYICFVILLVLLPKVASAIEFVLTPLYFIALHFEYSILFKTNFYSFDFSQKIYEINYNRICVIALVIFMIFKIIFFLYMKHNRERIYELEMDELI